MKASNSGKNTIPCMGHGYFWYLLTVNVTRKGDGGVEDSQIIDLYWQRDENAIVETKAKYGAYCHRIALNILSVREDAEECVSDTYYHAWRAIPPNRPEKFRLWLGKVVRNLSINQWKRDHTQKRNREMETLLSELEDCIPTANNVEKEIEATELGKFISAWLMQLDREDRILFVRRYWNGESLKNLAKDWGTSSNNLAGRMYRLRLGLKAALESEGMYL